MQQLKEGGNGSVAVSDFVKVTVFFRAFVTSSSYPIEHLYELFLIGRIVFELKTLII